MISSPWDTPNPQDHFVCLARGKRGIEYPHEGPFLPHIAYPEIKKRIRIGKEQNNVYDLVRRLFYEYGLDKENFSNDLWNPLGGLIKPGQQVLVKPNLVRHIHMENGEYDSVVTHGSVIRCVMDFICIALKGHGKIIVGDAPVQSADFNAICRKLKLREVCDDISTSWGISVRLMDFRLLKVSIDKDHALVCSSLQDGDEAGYLDVDLGDHSMLSPLDDHSEKLRVTSYDSAEMQKHHHRGKHEYLVAKSILESDVIINIPKLKTHRKVCLTAALKNLVGINGHKDRLPHHRAGAISEGGDEYLYPSVLKKLSNYFNDRVYLNKTPSLRLLYRFISKVMERLVRIICKDRFREGSWYGNDTAWRMALDLNRLIVYVNSQGKLQSTPQRKIFTVVDAIIAGEGEGPMAPGAKKCGIMACGQNSLAVDTCLAKLVGFDIGKIPLIKNGYKAETYKLAKYKPEKIEIISSDRNLSRINAGFSCKEFRFTPPSGWHGHVESQ